MESVLRKLITGLIIFSLLCLGTSLILDNQYARKVLRAAILDKVDQYTNLSVRFEDVHAKVVPPGVVFRNLSIATTADPQFPIFSSGDVAIFLSLWSLFFGEIRLSLVQVSDVIAVWPPRERYQDFIKSTKVPPKIESKGISWPLIDDLPLDRVSLTNVNFFAEIPVFQGVPFPADWLTISSVGSNLELDIDGAQDIEAQVDLSGVDLSFGPSSFLEKANLRTVLGLKGKKFSSQELEFTSERISLKNGSLQGELRTNAKHSVIDAIKLNCGGEVAGDLSFIGSILDLSDTRGRISGKARADLTIPLSSSGPGNELLYRIEGDAKVEGGTFAGFKVYDSAVRFVLNPEDLVFPDLEIFIGDHSFGHLTGKIAFNKEIDFSFRGEPENLQLEDLLSALNVDFNLFNLMMTSPDLTIEGRGDPLRINVDATAHVKDIKILNLHHENNRFAASPACLLQLKVGITDEKVDFSKTSGNCYLLPDDQSVSKHKVRAGSVEPPHHANHVSFLEVEGGINLISESIDLQIDSSEADLKIGQYFAQISLAGIAKIKTKIFGPLNAVKAKVESEIKKLAVMDYFLGDFVGSALIDSDRLLVDSSVVTPASGGKIEFKHLSLLLNDDLTLEIDGRVSRIKSAFFNDIKKVAGSDFPFVFEIEELDLKLKGPAKHPLNWRGLFSFRLRDFFYDDQKLFDYSEGKVYSDRKKLYSENWNFQLGSLGIKTNFSYDRQLAADEGIAHSVSKSLSGLGFSSLDKFTLEFSSENLAINDAKLGKNDQLEALPYVGTYLETARLRGLIDLSGKISGNFDDLQGSFKGKFNNLSVQDSYFSDVEFRGFIKNSQVDLTFSHLGQVLEGRLSLDVGKEGIPYSWYINAKRLDVRAFGTKVFYSDPRNFAYITAAWDMEGYLLDWWRSKGELSISDVRAKFFHEMLGVSRSLSLDQEKSVKLLFSPGGWKFDNDEALSLKGQYAAIKVSLGDMRPPENLGLNFEANIDLAVAKDLSDYIDTASGVVRIFGGIKGNVTDPEMLIEVQNLAPSANYEYQWQPLTLGFTEARPAFKNIEMRLLYSNERIIIDRFTAEKGSGTITAAGSISLSDLSDSQSRIEINLDDATFISNLAFLKSFESQISGKLNLTGNKFPYRLSGDLTFVKGRSTKELDIRSEIINALRTSNITTASVNVTPLFELDLNIDADRSININNRSLQAVLSTNLQIRGTNVQPVVLGQLDIDKGKFVYKRDFFVERGIVIFDNPIKPDPTLDILAVSEVDNYRVYIAITGKASQPVIEFAVDPPTRENGSPISKVEIIILLSRGSLPAENRSIGETQSAATSEALNLIMGQFEEPVEKLFDLSGQKVVRNIFIDTYPSTEGNPVPRLNLPLDLGDDFDVILRTDPTVDEVSGEYSIHENINLTATLERRRAIDEAQRASQASDDTKINLKFRFSFD